ncbi:MAG: nuclear transport factor 2 family protein [Pyrinomonadaceae bacterium]
MSNVQTVKAIYEAFGKGDVPFILSCLDENVDWEKWDDNYAQQAGVPYMRHIKGRDGVVNFFGEVAKLGVKGFEVLAIMEGENKIAVHFTISTENFDEDEIHLWTFNDEGKITGFRHYLDTAKHIAVAEKVRSSAAS